MQTQAFSRRWWCARALEDIEPAVEWEFGALDEELAVAE